ncbi:unnamed protein product [Lactuca saligna]|uniref:Uncharacterized protein n=1 Tax=Lactuca saligna TaxID=75948 RepID=A0AA36E1G5_LACSI|nr:unnamed protein product [Lactuca saligna]
MKNKGGFQEENDLNEFFNEAFEGNENVDGTDWMPSPVIQQFGSPWKSNRVNDDDDVDNPPEFDRRKQKQIVKKKKKKVVVNNIVDAENHIPGPPIAKPSHPWEGSAIGNPFDPLDGCKSWLEVDRIST